MPLIYAVIAKETTVLAESASSEGNFASAAANIIEKIAEQQKPYQKLTYVYDQYLFHYIVENGLIFMCMADSETGRRVPFTFLEDVKKQFTETYGDRVINALPYGMNEFSRVLSAQMEKYAGEGSIIRQVQGEIDQVRDVMVQNIEKVLDRGERIEILVNKTDSLNSAAFQFKKRSTALKRQMWWKNTKLMIILSVVIILILYFIICAACGFPGWSKCTG